VVGATLEGITLPFHLVPWEVNASDSYIDQAALPLVLFGNRLVNAGVPLPAFGKAAKEVYRYVHTLRCRGKQ